MLLNIYLGSIAIDLATTLIYSQAFENRYKREGYVKKKTKKPFSENVAYFLKIVFFACIPVDNILNAVGLIMSGDELYESMKNKAIKKGSIYMPNKEKTREEDKFSSKEEVKTYTESIEKTNTGKKYNEITVEEKINYLQQEKEKLKNQLQGKTENKHTLIKKRK